jgi:bla regulator protein BlaR1
VTSLSGQAQPPTFEVASIKPAQPGRTVTSSNVEPGGTLRIKNYTLKALIMYAYGVFDFQVSGGAGWVATDGFDIVAIADRVEAEPARRLEQARLRLQTLLADRFQLRTHRETKELPVYALVLAKALSRELGRPVEDQTGLTAAFDFKLKWTTDFAAPESGKSDAPSLFTALQQQLGLRLESRKGPVEVIMIDRASKPSEN